MADVKDDTKETVKQGTEGVAEGATEKDTKESTPAPKDDSVAGPATPAPATAPPATAPTATSSHAEPSESTGLLPPHHWTQLPDPERDDDADSALGSDAQSSTASISSSILQYRTILGRTYHSEMGNAQYWGSNDEVQNEALDIHHHVVTLIADGKLHYSPLKDDIQKVLDVGTGTGIWAIDFADEHPNTEVIGTDVSPIQPSWVPPNLKFEIEDCNQEWTFPPNSFDFVHARWLLGSIKDWTQFFKEAYKVLKPGGYLESNEGSPQVESDDGSVSPTSAMGQWANFFAEGERIMGQPFLVVKQGLQRKAMEEAGFVDIQEKENKIPLGSWPEDKKLKEAGQYSQLVLEQDADGIILYLANVIQGWTKEEIAVFVAHFRRELRSKNHHGYYRQKIVWGRKPEA